MNRACDIRVRVRVRVRVRDRDRDRVRGRVYLGEGGHQPKARVGIA